MGGSSGGSPKGGTGGTTGGSGGAATGGANTTGGTGGGSAGSSSGSAGTGTSGMCPNVTACGGDIVGTWNASASCLTLSGQLDLPTAGLDPRSCTSAPLTGNYHVTGSITFNADKTYTDNTTTSGTAHVDLEAGCLLISGTKIDCKGAATALEAAGLKPATCEVAATGGGCSCDSNFTRSGGIGIPTPIPGTSGNWITSGNTLTMTTDSGNTNHSYCTSGTTVTITPQSPSSTVIGGTITLTPPGSSGGAGGGGNGGSSGAAGMGANGGMGTGGANPMGGNGGSTGGQGGTGGAGAGGAGMGGSAGGGSVTGPCDIYGTTTPCVAAYSTIRRLSSKYTGPIVQIRSGSNSMNTGTGGTPKDFGTLSDGFIDTAAIDAFCMGTTCTVSLLYDQSGNDNHLPVAKKGNTAGGATGAEDDWESSATKGAVTAGGHKVYPLYMNKHEGYRLQKVGKNMPLKSAAEGIYEVADGTHAGDACCWDFGNVTTDPTKYGVMNTLFFGKAYWGNGAGSAPWFMADFEAGVWAGGSKPGDPGWGALDDDHPSNPKNPSMSGVPFAMGILKTQSSGWELRMANVASATDLTTAYEGALPKAMDNLGGIVLGVGGDNSNNSYGTFYEGAIVAGFPTKEIDLAVMKNVQAVGYKK